MAQIKFKLKRKNDTGYDQYLPETTASQIIEEIDKRFMTDAEKESVQNTAPKVHSHTAADITSGTVPIVRGGTGAASASEALTALGAAPKVHSHTAADVGAANASHNHSGSNITTGKIPFAQLPTGTTSTTVSTGNHTHATSIAGLSISGSAVAVGINAAVNQGNGIAIGADSLVNPSNGNYGIALGVSSRVTKQEGIAIGRYAEAGGDFSIALGTNAATSSSASHETIQLGAEASALRCKVNLTVTSDERDKADISEITKGLEFINKIEPVTYVSNARDKYLKASRKELWEKEREFTEKLSEAGLSIGDVKELIRQEVNGEVDEKGKTRLRSMGLSLNMFSNYADVLDMEELPLTAEQQEYKDQLATLRQYGMCDYDRGAHARGDKKGERQRVGVKAQQVIGALEEVYGTADYANIVNDNLHDVAGEVPEGVENQYTVAYTEFIPFLISAIKELKLRVEELERKATMDS